MFTDASNLECCHVAEGPLSWALLMLNLPFDKLCFTLNFLSTAATRGSRPSYRYWSCSVVQDSPARPPLLLVPTGVVWLSLSALPLTKAWSWNCCQPCLHQDPKCPFLCPKPAVVEVPVDFVQQTCSFVHFPKVLSFDLPSISTACLDVAHGSWEM